MLCAGFVGIGKTYVNQAVTTIVSFPLLKAKGVDLNMSPPPIGRFNTSEQNITHPASLATHEHQIALIESRGLNSKGFSFLHVGLVDLAKTTPLQLGQPMVS